MEPATYVDQDGVVHTICAAARSAGTPIPWSLTSCGTQLNVPYDNKVRVATCFACLVANQRPGKAGVFISVSEILDPVTM